MKLSVALGVVVATFCSATQVTADPFTVLPNGDLVFNTSFTTQGVFTCLPTIMCSASGSSVTINSGGNLATISFTGASADIQAGSTATRVTLGQFEGTASPGFTFPAPGPEWPILMFDFTLTHSSPVAGATARRWWFGPGGSATFLPFQQGESWMALPAGPNPPGYNYPTIVYSLLGMGIAANGVRVIQADVGAVPEPATLLLISTGLAGGMAYARRLRRLK